MRCMCFLYVLGYSMNLTKLFFKFPLMVSSPHPISQLRLCDFNKNQNSINNLLLKSIQENEHLFWLTNNKKYNQELQKQEGKEDEHFFKNYSNQNKHEFNEFHKQNYKNIKNIILIGIKEEISELLTIFHFIKQSLLNEFTNWKEQGSTY